MKFRTLGIIVVVIGLLVSGLFFGVALTVDTVSIVVPIVILVSVVMLALLFVILAVMSKRKKRILAEVKESGFLTQAEFGWMTTTRGLGDFGESHLAGYKITFWYHDENAKKRRGISREAFDFNKAKKLESMVNFPIRCRGKYFVIMTENIEDYVGTLKN